MNMKSRLQKMEDRIGRRDEVCIDHETTCVISCEDGRNDGLPDDAPSLPCSKCGKPGFVLKIFEEIVDGYA